ncbi:hypothetical protein GGX14DRAFT_603649 [Mycena pura]|uniref:Uncharacterized protein n=1 Tax=Mycena pura TaxID=153505 RepID=A0AAD6UQJ4_9AGAR|nr:hypothetical protein GGX14DRAFT_603649 [Mycena pura]
MQLRPPDSDSEGTFHSAAPGAPANPSDNSNSDLFNNRPEHLPPRPHYTASSWRLLLYPLHPPVVNVNCKGVLHVSFSAALLDRVGGLAIVAARSAKTDMHVSFAGSAREGETLWIARRAWARRTVAGEAAESCQYRRPDSRRRPLFDREVRGPRKSSIAKKIPSANWLLEAVSWCADDVDARGDGREC